MTFITSSDDVTRLIKEMQYWGDDPDLQRIADALPIELLERAYLKKLDELPADPALPDRATTARGKVAALRRVAAAWFRAPQLRLGQMLFNALDSPRNMGGGFEGEFYNIEDGALAQALERRYPPPK